MRRYNRSQLRQLWPVSDMTVWRAERQGGFPEHVTINRRNYWPADEVDAWLAARAQAPARKADNVATGLR
mgnify:CR=1 FL=1